MYRYVVATHTTPIRCQTDASFDNFCAQYEGVSRMQTSLRRRHRDRVVRRGMGMMIESDFYATEAGRSHFQDQLTVSQKRSKFEPTLEM